MTKRKKAVVPKQIGDMGKNERYWFMLEQERIDLDEQLRQDRKLLRKIHLILGFLLGSATMGILVIFIRVVSLMLMWWLS